MVSGFCSEGFRSNFGAGVEGDLYGREGVSYELLLGVVVSQQQSFSFALLNQLLFNFPPLK